MDCFKPQGALTLIVKLKRLQCHSVPELRGNIDEFNLVCKSQNDYATIETFSLRIEALLATKLWVTNHSIINMATLRLASSDEHPKTVVHATLGLLLELIKVYNFCHARQLERQSQKALRAEGTQARGSTSKAEVKPIIDKVEIYVDQVVDITLTDSSLPWTFLLSGRQVSLLVTCYEILNQSNLDPWDVLSELDLPSKEQPVLCLFTWNLTVQDLCLTNRNKAGFRLAEDYSLQETYNEQVNTQCVLSCQGPSNLTLLYYRILPSVRPMIPTTFTLHGAKYKQHIFVRFGPTFIPIAPGDLFFWFNVFLFMKKFYRLSAKYYTTGQYIESQGPVFGDDDVFTVSKPPSWNAASLGSNFFSVVDSSWTHFISCQKDLCEIVFDGTVLALLEPLSTDCHYRGLARYQGGRVLYCTSAEGTVVQASHSDVFIVSLWKPLQDRLSEATAVVLEDGSVYKVQDLLRQDPSLKGRAQCQIFQLFFPSIRPRIACHLSQARLDLGTTPTWTPSLVINCLLRIYVRLLYSCQVSWYVRKTSALFSRLPSGGSKSQNIHIEMKYAEGEGDKLFMSMRDLVFIKDFSGLSREAMTLKLQSIRVSAKPLHGKTAHVLNIVQLNGGHLFYGKVLDLTPNATWKVDDGQSMQLTGMQVATLMPVSVDASRRTLDISFQSLAGDIFQETTDPLGCICVHPRLLAVEFERVNAILMPLRAESYWYTYADLLNFLTNLIEEDVFAPLLEYPPEHRKLYKLMSRRQYVSYSPLIHYHIWLHESVVDGVILHPIDGTTKDDAGVNYSKRQERPEPPQSVLSSGEDAQLSSQGFFVSPHFADMIKIPTAQSFLATKIDNWLRRLRRHRTHPAQEEQLQVVAEVDSNTFNGTKLMSVLLRGSMWKLQAKSLRLLATSTLTLDPDYTVTWQIFDAFFLDVSLLSLADLSSSEDSTEVASRRHVFQIDSLSAVHERRGDTFAIAVQDVDFQEQLPLKTISIIDWLLGLWDELSEISSCLKGQLPSADSTTSRSPGIILELQTVASLTLCDVSDSIVLSHDGYCAITVSDRGIYFQTKSIKCFICTLWDCDRHQLMALPPLNVVWQPETGLEIATLSSDSATSVLWLSLSLYDLGQLLSLWQSLQCWEKYSAIFRLQQSEPDSEEVNDEASPHSPTGLGRTQPCMPFQILVEGFCGVIDSVIVMCEDFVARRTEQNEVETAINGLEVIVQGEKDLPQVTHVQIISYEYDMSDSRLVITDVTSTSHLSSLGDALKPFFLIPSFWPSESNEFKTSSSFDLIPSSFTLTGLLLHATTNPIKCASVDFKGLLSQVRQVYFRCSSSTNLSTDMSATSRRLQLLMERIGSSHWLGAAMFLQYLRIYAPIPPPSTLSERDTNVGWWANVCRIVLDKRKYSSDILTRQNTVCDCPRSDKPYLNIKLAASELAVVWLASSIGPDSAMALKQFFNAHLQTYPLGDRLLKSVLQLSLSTQLQISAQAGHLNMEISKTFCTLNHRDFLNLRLTADDVQTCLYEITRLTRRFKRKMDPTSAPSWHMHCFRVHLGQGSLTLESSINDTVSSSSEASAAVDTLSLSPHEDENFTVLVRRLAAKSVPLVRPLLRCLFGNLIVHVDWDNWLQRTKCSVDLGDILVHSSSEKQGSDATISLAPLGATTEETPLLSWRAAAIKEQTFEAPNLAPRRPKRSRLRMSHSSSASIGEADLSKATCPEMESKTVYEFVHLQIQPVMIDLSQKFLVELMAFFSVEDEEKDALMASWQDAEARLIGDATQIQPVTSDDGASEVGFTRIAKQDFSASEHNRSRLSQVVLKLKGGSAERGNTTLVKDLRIYSMHMALSYQGIMNVQDAFVHLPEISTQNIYTDALSTLVYRDLSWEVIKQVVSQVLSSKVKSMVGKVSAHRRWRDDDSSEHKGKHRRRFRVLHRPSRIETADQMIQGMLRQKSGHQQSRRERFLANAICMVSGTPQASFDNYECTASSGGPALNS